MLRNRGSRLAQMKVGAPFTPVSAAILPLGSAPAPLAGSAEAFEATLLGPCATNDAGARGAAFGARTVVSLHAENETRSTPIDVTRLNMVLLRRGEERTLTPVYVTAKSLEPC
jgi:hypothetical protein